MTARLIVFPVRGRNWCFSRSIQHSITGSESAQNPSTLKDLWKKISTEKPVRENAELLVDFVSNKMNKGWSGLEKAPEGSFKNRIYGLGLRLLARVKPSEIFLKSISKDITKVEVAFPSSLNPRLVRRRLRHIALRGAVIHKKYFYGSVTLLPLTTAFAILPMPNIPFFWVLFRTYSHWRALQGSEKLIQLVTDCSEIQNSGNGDTDGTESKSKFGTHDLAGPPWVLKPSEDLEKLLHCKDDEGGLSQCAITDICKNFDLNANDVLKYRNSL